MGNNAMNALHKPIIHKEGKSKNTDSLYQASDFNSEACKTQVSMRPLASDGDILVKGEIFISVFKSSTVEQQISCARRVVHC